MYSVTVYNFHSANSHLEMQLNDIIIVFVTALDAYTITDTDPLKWLIPISVSGIGASLSTRAYNREGEYQTTLKMLYTVIYEPVKSYGIFQTL